MSTTREKDIAAAMRVDRSKGTAIAFADGCAHRDKQTIAFLEGLLERVVGDERFGIYFALKAIKLREHVK
jgi:hypothetical protein